MKNRVIWVTEYRHLFDAECVLDLYESEQDALSAAVDEAIKHMENMGANSPSSGQVWNEFYQNVLAAKTAKDFRLALKTYVRWSIDHLNIDDVYSILVYDKQVTPRKPPMEKMEPIPDYGELIPLKDFIVSCQTGMFIDSDGIGNYATATEMSDIEACPSDITNGKIQKQWTHVCWFNK
jgi:hypothetical protein